VVEVVDPTSLSRIGWRVSGTRIRYRCHFTEFPWLMAHPVAEQTDNC
jgi:hypothetical protein